ncbi:Abi family protein [Gleimia hominis]|uniref:Abi family protein n=1 Tax=Gleimia hominis TaxID=595468 RepID=A0ABU3ICU8_9ACTO|nr:Abi family protein [Gleimia hominis]MDT3768188.1 Abi family protein [Gleimia hominis]
MSDKPWVSVDEQTRILMQRGMADAGDYRRELATIGYYRISGYSYPLRRIAPAGSSRQRLDHFIPGARMRHALELYEFDERLRLAAWQAMCKLEVCLRVDVGHVLGELDPFIHLDLEQYWTSGKMSRRAKLFTQKLTKTQSRSSEDFVTHYNESHDGRLPVWVATEILEFGQLVTLFSLAPFEQRRRIAEQYSTRADELESWMRTANFVRNVCAHHARLWNRQLVIRPLIKYRRNDPTLSTATQSAGRMYAALTLIAFLLRRGGFTDEIQAIKHTLDSFPNNIPGVDMTHMGASADWNQQPVWKTSI